MDKPERDDFFVLATKKYNKDGSIQVVTEHFTYHQIHAFEFDNGCLYLRKHETPHPDRDQLSYYPLTEVVQFDYNPLSKTYHEAMAAWVKQELGISYDDYLDTESKGNQENYRVELAKRFGVDPSSIEFFDFRDGSDGPF